MLRRNGQCMFLSIIGPTTYKLLSSMIAPDKPGEKSYEDLVKVLKEHHNPTPSEIVQRYKFHTRIRKPEESTTQFVVELRALAQYCNFGASLTDLLEIELCVELTMIMYKEGYSRRNHSRLRKL